MVIALRLLLIFLTVTFAHGPIRAGWITIRNDTMQELTVQEVILVNGKTKAVKSIKLLPGESIKENKSTAGSKNVQIFDSNKPNTLLLKGKVEWGKDDATFSITSEKQSIVLQPVAPSKKP